MTSENYLIHATQVREIVGGISRATLWRWINAKEYQELQFPKPTIIAKRLYWRQKEIKGWVDSQSTESQ